MGVPFNTSRLAGRQLPGAASMLTPDALPHPAVWRASGLSQGVGRCIAPGHAGLAAELPGGGWPCGNLIEFLLPRTGVGELHLLLPALASLPAARSVVLVQPPYQPNPVCWATWRLDPAQLLWIRPQTESDALWAAAQVLKNGSCAALLCWLPQVRTDALRRLQAAALASDTLFVVMRPGNVAPQASPAPLRLALQPAPGGVLLRFVKRRGPPRELPLYVALHAPSSSGYFHAPLDQPAPVPSGTGLLASA